MRRIIPWLVVGALLHSGASAMSYRTFPVPLSESDTRALERAICRDPHGVRIDRAEGHKRDEESAAQAGLKPDDVNAVYADVECQPHSSEGTIPVRFATSCRGIASDWKCAEPHLEYLANVAGKFSAVSALGVTPESAVDLVEWLGSRGTYEGRSLQEIAQQDCHVYSNDPRTYSVSCGGWGVYIAVECTSGECRRSIMKLSLLIP